MDVVREVRKVRRFLFWRSLLSGLFVVGMLASGGPIVALALAEITGPAPKFRTFFLLFYSVAIIGGSIYALFRALVRLPSGSEILRMAEKSDPYFQERAATAHYLLTKPEDARNLGYSPVLVERTLKWAKNISPEALFGRFYSLKNLQWLVTFTFLPVLLLLLIVLLRGNEAEKVWLEYLNAQYEPKPAEHAFLFPPGDIMVGRGERLEIPVFAEGTPLFPLLYLRDASGKWTQKELRLRAGDDYRVEIPKVDRPYLYRVGDRGIYSPTSRITPLDPPKIAAIAWRVITPLYTGLADYEKRGTNEIEVPRGSQVSLSVRSDLDLVKASLEYGKGLYRVFKKTDDPKKVTIDLPLIEENAAFRLHLEGPLRMKTSVDSLRVEVIPDSAPRVKIVSPAPVAEIPDSQTLEIGVEARDDYGLGKVELIYELNYSGDTHRVEVPFPSGATTADSEIAWQATSDSQEVSPRALDAKGSWDLNAHDLLPGDEVSYWIEARDNDPSGGNKIGKSRVHLLRFPSLFETYKDIETAQAAQVDSLQDVLERQKKIREEIEKTADDLRQKTSESDAMRQEKPSWEEKKRMEDLVESEKKVGENLKVLDKEIQETLKALEEKSETSLVTLTKMEKVRELLDELMTDEMRNVLRDFQSMMSEFNQNRDPGSLDNLSGSLKDFEEELDSMLKLLENTRFQRQFEAAMMEAKDLLEAQEKIVERTQDQMPGTSEVPGTLNEASDKLAGEEQEVQDRLEALSEQLENLANEAEKQGLEGSEDLRKAAEDLKKGEIPKNLDEAQKELSKGNFESALPPEQSAAKEMKSLLSQLSETQGGMCGMSLEQDMKGLLTLIHRAQYVSELEEDAIGRLESITRQNRWGNPERKKSFSQDQSDLMVETGRARQAFIEFASKSPFRDFEVARLLDGAARDMNSAAAGTKDRPPALVRSLSKASLRKVNLAIRKLMESLSQAAQAQGGMSLESYFQQLKQLIQRQKGLNDQTRLLDMRDSSRPSWQEELERIAREQEAVRQELEKLAEQQKKAKELLGDMDGIGDEMGDIEKMLQERITDERVQEKQEQVYTRLLDAERSQRQQDTDRERESTPVSREFAAEEVPPLTENGVLRRLDQPEDRLAGDEVLPRYRSRVRSYYRRLSEQVFSNP